MGGRGEGQSKLSWPSIDPWKLNLCNILYFSSSTSVLNQQQSGTDKRSDREELEKRENELKEKALRNKVVRTRKPSGQNSGGSGSGGSGSISASGE